MNNFFYFYFAVQLVGFVERNILIYKGCLTFDYKSRSNACKLEKQVLWTDSDSARQCGTFTRAICPHCGQLSIHADTPVQRGQLVC